MSQINKDIERILVSEGEINEIVRRIAAEIDRDYAGDDSKARAALHSQGLGRLYGRADEAHIAAGGDRLYEGLVLLRRHIDLRTR